MSHRVLIDGVEYVPRMSLATEWSPWPTLGAALKARRKACHLTLEAASKRVPCSKSYLWEVEHDKGDPSFRIVAALAAIYGTPLDWLPTSKDQAP